MFIGENKIVLNEATMKKAVEHYLNTQVLDSLAMVTVTSIADGDSQGWTVHFEPLPAPEPPKVAEAA